MDLLIALQTHNVSNNQDTLCQQRGESFVRYGCNDKTEIIKRCTRSLIASLNYAQRQLPGLSIRLHIFDDHSTDEGIQVLRDNLQRAEFPTTLTSIESCGLMASLRACYEDLRDHGKELVMQAQDDYLFDEVCFYQTILMWAKFSPRFAKPLSLLPYNDPYRYLDHNIVPVRIVQGPDRHWRQTYQVPCTFFTHHAVITQEWDVFEKICSGHPHDPRLEDDSVNRLWQEREYVVMSPIPTLSLHFQTDSEKDPYLDWRTWWDKHADEEQPTQTFDVLFQSDERRVLNVGCGTTRLSSQSSYFEGWKEVRVDAFPNPTVDIIDTTIELAKIPPHSVDAVWASHVIEHQYWHEIPQVLRSFLRVLKPKGFAIIRVPDLGAIAERIPERLLEPVYQSSAGPVSPIDMLYGARWLVEHQGEGMAHKTGFTEQSMRAILQELNIRHVIKKGYLELHVFIFPDEPPLSAICHPKLVK